MFEISIRTHFSGAHYLSGYPGACANLHGHNWEVEVFLRGPDTDSLGMLMDFKTLKTGVNQTLDELDHRELNRLPMFADRNPTAEFLARYLYLELSRRLNAGDLRVHRVWVSETPGTSATYWDET